MVIGGRSALEWVVLDVGETLIDETRAWDIWAEVLGIGRPTLAAALGATIAADDHHDTLFDVLRVPDWRSKIPEVERRFGGFQAIDLYPDALRSIEALRGLGLRLGVVANQPASRTAELRSIGVDADVIAMSDELGVAKPDPRVLRPLARAVGGRGSRTCRLRRRSSRQRPDALACGRAQGRLDQARPVGRDPGTAGSGGTPIWWCRRSTNSSRGSGSCDRFASGAAIR